MVEEVEKATQIPSMVERTVFALDLGRRADDHVYSENDISDLFYLTKDTVKDLSGLALESGLDIKRSIRLNRYSVTDGEKRDEKKEREKKCLTKT